MTIFFTLSFVVTFLSRILLGVFVDRVSVFAKLLTPLTVLTAVFGALAAIFIVIKIFKELKR